MTDSFNSAYPPCSARRRHTSAVCSHGNVLARYSGAYVWDGGREEVTFWTAAESGELHRGRAWWRDGVLWHEAEVSGGSIEGYASAVRPAEGRFEYFAGYSRRDAGPYLLDTAPLVYTRETIANADGSPSPGGRPSEHSFRLTRSAAGFALFEAPDHDFPKRIRYSHGAVGALTARIDGGEGDTRVQEWRMLPVQCNANQ